MSPGSSRALSTILAAGALIAVVAFLVQSYGASALIAIGLAVICSLLVTSIWASVLRARGALLGAVCIGCGVISAIIGCYLAKLNVKAGPLAAFSGAVCGGGVWVIVLCARPSGMLNGKSIADNEAASHGNMRKAYTGAYLRIALGASLAGPVVGALSYVLWLNFIGIHPLDRSYALLYHLAVGGIAGLTAGAPYFLVWLLQVSRIRSR